jgi:hypothetical protein
MRNETRVTMVAPSAGFSTRVMARIEEHERSQARQRAWIGAILLAAIVTSVFVLVALWLASWIISIVATPSTIAPIIRAITILMGDGGSLVQATWGAITTIARNVSDGSLLVYALVVLGMTALWAYVASGSFHYSLAEFRVGGSK